MKYNTVHVPQVLSVNHGPKSGFRFTNGDAKAPWPYLALYPVDDVTNTDSMADAVVKIKSHDAILPDGAAYTDFTKFDVRYYTKVETLGSATSRIGKLLILVAVEPGPGAPELWYDPAHMEMLKAQKGYLRSHGYQAIGGRVDGGSEGETIKVPKYLGVHEFESSEAPSDHIEFSGGPDPSRRLFKEADEVVRDAWNLIFEAGDETVGL